MLVNKTSINSNKDITSNYFSQDLLSAILLIIFFNYSGVLFQTERPMKNNAFYTIFSFFLYDRLKNFILDGKETFVQILKAFNYQHIIQTSNFRANG